MTNRPLAFHFWDQSPDLTNWTALPGTVDFTITSAGPAPQFFRVMGSKP